MGEKIDGIEMSFIGLVVLEALLGSAEDDVVFLRNEDDNELFTVAADRFLDRSNVLKYSWEVVSSTDAAACSTSPPPSDGSTL